MLLLKHIFIILHIITAAAWFGLGLRLATQARTVLQLDRAAAQGLAEDTQRTVRFMSLFAVLTLVFAYITFFIGGPGNYNLPFHLASGLILVLVGVQFALVQPGWTKLHEAVRNGGDAAAFRKRIAMGMGIGQLLWLIILVLMFWNRLTAAASA